MSCKWRLTKVSIIFLVRLMSNKLQRWSLIGLHKVDKTCDLPPLAMSIPSHIDVQMIWTLVLDKTNEIDKNAIIISCHGSYMPLQVAPSLLVFIECFFLNTKNKCYKFIKKVTKKNCPLHCIIVGYPIGDFDAQALMIVQLTSILSP